MSTDTPQSASRSDSNTTTDTDPAHVCEFCESAVSANYARVRGDNNNVVHRCPNCASKAELAHGLSAGLERRYHVRGGY